MGMTWVQALVQVFDLFLDSPLARCYHGRDKKAVAGMLRWPVLAFKDRLWWSDGANHY